MIAILLVLGALGLAAAASKRDKRSEGGPRLPPGEVRPVLPPAGLEDSGRFMRHALTSWYPGIQRDALAMMPQLVSAGLQPHTFGVPADWPTVRAQLEARQSRMETIGAAELQSVVREALAYACMSRADVDTIWFPTDAEAYFAIAYDPNQAVEYFQAQRATPAFVRDDGSCYVAVPHASGVVVEVTV